MWTQSGQREFTAHVFGEAFPGAAAAAAAAAALVGQLIITAAETRAKDSAPKSRIHHRHQSFSLFMSLESFVS